MEAKAWETGLDRATRVEGAPSTQLLRYLGRVEIESEGGIRFGLLSNGRIWRLYDQKARSRLEGFMEIDMFEAIGRIVPADAAAGGEPGRADHILRLFLFLFGRDAFTPSPGGRTRLEQAIADSRSFEARVTKGLAEVVFGRVFPDLADALADADPQRPDPITPGYLAELREAALSWLYRLLFVLYAEDRDLLPTRRRRDGLRATRNEVARAIDAGTALSRTRTNHDGDLRALWRQVDEGDDDIGVPPYNGGLFRLDRSPLLERSLIPDRAFAPLLDALSREGESGARRLINYRDLDVQHLGSVYERLLEYELVHDSGRISTRPQAFARKTSGSYYTPEELVMLVIRRTIGPLLDEKRAAFDDALANPERARQSPEYRLPWLAAFDPASEFLTLRICDPAMGSGHFLVSLVDYLADQVMLATREASELVAERIEDAEYRSPLLDRLDTIRARILEEAAHHGWTVLPEQLADDKLVRRIILTGTAPVFRTPRDSDLTTAMYGRLPVLVRHRALKEGRGPDSGAVIAELGLGEGSGQADERPWPVRYATMFHMTNDRLLFRKRGELEADGWYETEAEGFQKGSEKAAPLYVGRMFNQFDHRAASVTVNEDNLHNPANSERISADQKADPSFRPEPQFWVEWKNVDPQRDWTLAFRDIARPTDVRTIIAAILPGAAYGNTAGLLLLDSAADAALLCGNLNAFVLDYVARQKVQGTHANWYIVEQLPVVPPIGYQRIFGAMRARDIVLREVLHLTYSAHDMAPFARALGHDGPPFPWNVADRRQRRARLDALYFLLYGLSREDADYILSTFPIVRRHDEDAFDDRYVTRDLILGHMSALHAGDTEAVIALR